MWIDQRRELGDLRTIAHEIRGHGSAPLGVAEGTLAQLGRDLIERLEEVGPSACVGFSLGGAVALWAASERPDLVERVVAIATSSIVGRTAVADLTRRISTVRAQGAEAVRDMLTRDTAAQLPAGFADFDRVVAERLRAVSDPRGYLNGLRAVRSMGDGSLHRRLARVRSPVLVVAAELDDVCPRRAAEILLDGLPHARLEEIAGAHHLVSYTDGAAVTGVIRRGLEAR